MCNIINPLREGRNKCLSTQSFDTSCKEIVCKLVASDIGFPDNANQRSGFASVNFYICKYVSGFSGRFNQTLMFFKRYFRLFHEGFIHSVWLNLPEKPETYLQI